MAKYYYNGVLLPEIPTADYGSCTYLMILRGRSSGAYWIYGTSTKPYYNVQSSVERIDLDGGRTRSKYNAETTSWENANVSTSGTWLNLTETWEVVWSNFNIPNGSATSTTIYFYATDPIPENEAKPKELDYSEVVDIYPSSGKINYSVNDQTVNYVVPVKKYSTYTVAMTEVGNRLRAVYSSVDPTTIKSNISATDIVMNPSFSVGYTFTYFAQEDGWMVVYVSNAGEYPKISIVTNGAGGDGAPLYDRKYLVKSGSTLYTVTDGALSALTETEVTASLFQTYGVDDLPDNSLLMGLADPEVLYWHDSENELPELTLTVTGSPPMPQTIITNTQDMSDSTILGIEGIQAVCSDNILFALSFDDETTWKAYDGTTWITLDLPNTGMTKTTMESIGLEAWAEVVTSDYYKVRFILPTTTSYMTSMVVNYIN